VVSAVWDEDEEADEEDINVAVLCCGSRRRRISCMVINNGFVFYKVFQFLEFSMHLQQMELKEKF